MIELLISAVNKNPAELLELMNVKTDAVLVNQCDREDDYFISRDTKKVHVICNNLRGVGRSRNLCIENSKADIIVFSDEDIRYRDNYEAVIEKAFMEKKDADMLLFNVEVCENRRTYWNDRVKRINYLNFGPYPAYSIAVKREALIKNKIRYSLLFGGGAKYSNGEDSLFLKDALKNKLRIYAVTAVIGREEERESTWFKGYTEKFFYDRGVLFCFLYGKLSVFFILRFIIVKKEMFKGKIKRLKALSLMLKGYRRGYTEKSKLA